MTLTKLRAACDSRLTPAKLQAMIREAVLKERRACAEVCDEIERDSRDPCVQDGAAECGAAIRARGDVT